MYCGYRLGHNKEFRERVPVDRRIAGEGNKRIGRGRPVSDRAKNAKGSAGRYMRLDIPGRASTNVEGRRLARNGFLLFGWALVIGLALVLVPFPDGAVAVVFVCSLSGLAIFVFRASTDEKDFVTSVFLIG